MNIKLHDGNIDLPDVLYLDQLAQLDLSMINKLSTLKDEESLNGDMINWLINLFKVLGVERRFSMQDLVDFKKDDQLVNWFNLLFSGFQPSN